MAVNAMHADVEMDRREVYRFLEFLWIGVINWFVFLVQQRTFPVALEDVAEIPAVAMIIGELRVFERRVELRHFL